MTFYLTIYYFVYISYVQEKKARFKAGLQDKLN